MLNAYSRENASGTPDFILAQFMLTCLKGFEEATRARAEWRSEQWEFEPWERGRRGDG